jgi:hypothetical protein
VLSQSQGAVLGAHRGQAARLASAGIRRFKMLDQPGQLHGVDLDDAGKPVGHEEVQRAVNELTNRGFVGKLETDLAERLSTHDDMDVIYVILWLKAEETPAWPCNSR